MKYLAEMKSDYPDLFRRPAFLTTGVPLDEQAHVKDVRLYDSLFGETFTYRTYNPQYSIKATTQIDLSGAGRTIVMVGSYHSSSL